MNQDRPEGAVLMEPGKPLILVTGATGYLGGRLVPRLLATGRRVRCLARNPERLAGRRWPGVDVVKGDVSDPASLESALRGVTQVSLHWFMPWGRTARISGGGICVRRGPSQRPARRPVCAGSSTWAGWGIPPATAAITWPAARRWGPPWPLPGFPCWNSGRR